MLSSYYIITIVTILLLLWGSLPDMLDRGFEAHN
jgi:hypothetical protein